MVLLLHVFSLIQTPISAKVTTNQYEIPTADQLKAAGDALLDNVSEESVELELPPPMVELQDLPTANAIANDHPDEEAISIPDIEEQHLPGCGVNSTLNISTVGDLHVRPRSICHYVSCNFLLITCILFANFISAKCHVIR